MRDRETILTEFETTNDGLQIGKYLLEALLDIRDQGMPVELIAEAQPLSKDRVVLSVGYTYFLLSDTMTAQDVTTLIRFFSEVQTTDFQFNVLTDDRPKVEIVLVPRDKITMPGDPDAIVPFTQAEATRDDSDHCPHCGTFIVDGQGYTDTEGVANNEKFCNKEHLEAYRSGAPNIA